MFQTNSRVERNKGIKFYEQDVLCADYVFVGDITIDLSVDYLYPGVGILLTAYNGKPLSEADHVYLFKLGDNSFNVIERHFLSQSTPVEASCAFASSSANTNANLIFTKRGQLIELNLVTYNAVTGLQDIRELGHYTIKNTIDKYCIGFYSNAGNTLRYASIASGIPTNWIVNIKNTNGGRVSFFKDGFVIEGCEYDAELEQEEINLKAGTYYIGFEKGLVNEINDIKCFVFHSSDTRFDDVKKNILVNGKIVLNQDGPVNIKFKGTNGRITDVCIKDLEDDAYVATDLEAVTHDGSHITVDLTRLKSVRWTGTINALPEHDLTQECPYGIVVTKHERLTQAMANIALDKEYHYEYTVATKELLIRRDNELYRILKIDLREDDANKLIIFQNMVAIITELIIVDDEDNEIDVLIQKTFRKYVPSTISGPITITDEYGAPLDLSSTYREVVIPTWDIELFGQDATIELQHRILNEGECVFVYGIPFGAVVNMKKRDSIETFSDRYTLLQSSRYNINYEDGIITVNPSDRKFYKYIAVKYQQADQFSYMFPLYEREVFLDSREPIVLDKRIADVSGAVIVYGIPADAKLHNEYFYRIPHKTMVNSIDLYASKYDIIYEANYSINYERPEINIAPETRALYKTFVIDYLKDDSFSINYLHNYGQYEVEICTNKEVVYMSYEMGVDGTVTDYKITNIKPDKNKYIVLRKT